MAEPPPSLRPHVPVLDRSPTELQVGLDEGIVLPAQPEIRAALAGLNGTRPLARVAQDSGLSRGQLVTLIGHLRTAGLLAEPVDVPRRLVRLLGAGVLARAFAEEYAASPPGELQVVDPGPPTPGLYVHPLPTAAETLRAHLRALGGQRISTASHWYRPEGPTADITVIAFDRLECDRAITDTLLRADQPHLFVRPLPDGAIVGPLVVPGSTCCTRCMDLVRTRDRAWPRLLAQLCLAECRPPQEVLRWAAATAVLQVRAWLSGGQPEAVGSTLEIRTDSWVIAQRHWPFHPDCGCSELQGSG
ncbi:hypothetical protein [Granulicoccus sp. GXG6511]|uniref:hypothetical protein n=1 Tax=Granulicoccus sp. GXG6511 TaxID=3381351 RepID=UPI003D7E403D